jgi:serine/threonine protein kinase
MMFYLGREKMISPTLQEVIKNVLEKIPLLDSRFKSLKCINYDPVKRQFKGNFSIVFQCFDIVTKNHAVLKFMDPECIESYRMDAFDREAEILKKLEGVNRCIQIINGLTSSMVNIQLFGGSTTQIPCKYFAVEWLPGDIEDYFLNQDLYPPLEKLGVLKEIILATEALHQAGIHHRDLKPDNFRVSISPKKRTVKAVDLGTATHFDIPRFPCVYSTPVGHQFYASSRNNARSC